MTMLFGSFIGGSTPLGGGAVAFPVFTKLLNVPAPVARSFALSVQAVGLSVAAVTILLTRRPVEGRALVVGSLLSLRSRQRGSEQMPAWNGRVFCGLCIAGLIGGFVSSLVGSGANVFIFVFLVVLCGVRPRVGVSTSIVAMAGVSVLGIAMLGFADGQLDIGLSAAGEVVSVGGTSVGPLPARQFDLFGLWIASIPVVVWGASLGTWLVSVLHEDRLVAFVGVMAAVRRRPP
ncbi:MAG: hypothetical protein V3R95_02565 [Dehalococcoidia bacterium]